MNNKRSYRFAALIVIGLAAIFHSQIVAVASVTFAVLSLQASE